MEFTGQVRDISRDYKTKEWRITLSVNETGVLEPLGALQGDVSIKVEKFRKKKSLNANDYLWKLLDLIAHHPDIKSTKDEVYEEILRSYGFLDYASGRLRKMRIPAEDDIKYYEGHWLFEDECDGWKSYIAIRGTSTYSQQEMSFVIDAVVEEAKGLGIETLPPAEIERMKAAWHSKA